MAATHTSGVPAVEILLDRPRRMTLSLGALRRVKEATGSLAALDLHGEEFIEHMDAVAWAALAGEDETLTRRQVAEELIHAGNVEMVGAKLGELMALTFPDLAAGADPLDSKPKPNRAKGKKPAA